MDSKSVEHVIQFIRQAGEILLQHHEDNRREKSAVDFKKDAYDPVTLADRTVDAFLRDQIQKFFPDDHVISEENELSHCVYQGRVWLVDPLDGTKDFIKGRDCFSINVGLVENNRPMFGCVCLPARHELYHAIHGQGAFLQQGQGPVQKIKVSAQADICQARLITRHAGNDVRPVEDIIATLPFREFIPEGSIGTKLCLVANGRAEAHINTNFRASKWDTLAPGLILTEAGGIITDFDGAALDYTQSSMVWERSFVASNSSVIHKQIVAKIRL